MIPYKLLTPGPLSTSASVKNAMLTDHCTWDEDYKKITAEIISDLLDFANASKENYTAVLMQGSGSFGVESVISSVVGSGEKILLLSNGAYGERLQKICDYANIPYSLYSVNYDEIFDSRRVAELLEQDNTIGFVAMVHNETTSGILNEIDDILQEVKKRNKIFILDAMSSFGGIEIEVEKLGIDFLISSSNKCIEGVPGFSFILAKTEEMKKTKGKARSLSLDLYGQWESMNQDGKWRFTSPTHTVLAFAQAIQELKREGGIPARSKRYHENNHRLIQKLRELGFSTYIQKNQGPIITSFFYPKNKNFSFQEFYEYVKERGYAIYPGKVTDADTFRIGNIGQIFKEDIDKVCEIVKEFLER